MKGDIGYALVLWRHISILQHDAKIVQIDSSNKARSVRASSGEFSVFLQNYILNQNLANIRGI